MEKPSRYPTLFLFISEINKKKDKERGKKPSVCVFSVGSFPSWSREGLQRRATNLVFVKWKNRENGLHSTNHYISDSLTHSRVLIIWVHSHRVRIHFGFIRTRVQGWGSNECFALSFSIQDKLDAKIRMRNPRVQEDISYQYNQIHGSHITDEVIATATSHYWSFISASSAHTLELYMVQLREYGGFGSKIRVCKRIYHTNTIRFTEVI